jgi:integrase
MAKRRGAHLQKALSAIQIRNLSKPGRYADGNGLYLVVDPTGAKRWMLRTVVQGKRRDIGLGSTVLVSLAEARDAAMSLRRSARSGADPLAERQRARVIVPTFAEAAERVHADHKASWRNEKHRAQWIDSLRQYAFPELGTRRIDRIDTPEIMRVLVPIWLVKPETARRVRQRIGSVLDWAKAAGFRSGDNPVEGTKRGLPKQPAKTAHHAAMPYPDVPAFIARLRESEVGEAGRLAFEFLILTASRTGEVLGARWAEINFDQKIWTVPANRMKVGRPHRVPLSKGCVDILARAKELAGASPFIFSGKRIDHPLSKPVFLLALHRIGVNSTVHGFRSSFRDWAAECTNVPREVAEMALAHTVENRVEAAYRRGDLFEKRRDLMERWAAFCEPMP